MFTTAINDNCIILNKDFLKQYQLNYSLIENKKNMPQNNCKEEPICIIKYNLSISKDESDIKQMLLEYLHIINIECFISNIKLFDSKNKCEIKSISDLYVLNSTLNILRFKLSMYKSFLFSTLKFSKHTDIFNNKYVML